MSSNLTLFSELRGQYSIYGIEHFKKKYGLISVDNKQTADIYIGYSVPDIGNPKVQILLNPATIDKICLLNINDEIRRHCVLQQLRHPPRAEAAPALGRGKQYIA